jgi:hypothetical protein
MRKVIRAQYNEQISTLLSKIGYVFHCKETNQICFHRSFHSGRFPRFHLLITPEDNSFALDLHIDQYSMESKGNHGETWAYTGIRVLEELRRISELIKNGEIKIQKIVRPNLGFVDSSKRDGG